MRQCRIAALILIVLALLASSLEAANYEYTGIGYYEAEAVWAAVWVDPDMPEC